MKNVLDVMSFGDFEYYKNLASDVAYQAELDFDGCVDDDDERSYYVHATLENYYNDKIAEIIEDRSDDYIEMVKSFFR